jgi:ABC-type multidrug transport system ATPase subunit
MLIALQNIYKKFKGQLVLKDVNLTINEGEIYFLIGPNGSGKSTLMNIVLGIVFADEGQVQMQLKANQIGTSLSIDTFFPNLSAKKNILYYAEVFGINKYDVNENPFFSILSEYGKKPVRKYSSGMKKVLSLAIAFINKPKLLLLDEPTNFLDIKNKAVFKDILARLKNNGTAVVVSSHNTEEIESIAGICAFLHKGVVKYVAETTTVLAEFGSIANAYKHHTL